MRHEGGGYLVRCNRSGFRCDHEFIREKPNGCYRVLLFGDSYAAGDGVSNGRRFGDVLERLLPRLQVLNFALPGTGTDQQHLSFREFARGLDYDLLLLCPMVENIQRNVQKHRATHSVFDGRLVWQAKPYFELRDDGELVLHHSPVPKEPDAVGPDDPPNGTGEGDGGLVRRVLRGVMRRLDDRIPGLRSCSQRLRRLALPCEYNDASDPAWALMKAILKRWVAENDEDLLLCPLPTFAHIEGGIRSDPYLARFRELCDETGTELVDLLPSFLALPRYKRLELRFPRDEHPTPECHGLIAEALAPRIRERMVSEAGA